MLKGEGSGPRKEQSLVQVPDQRDVGRVLTLDELKKEIFDRQVPFEYQTLHCEFVPQRQSIDSMGLERWHAALTKDEDHIQRGEPIAEDDLKEFGRRMRDIISGRTVIDLGAGGPPFESPLCKSAQSFGAKRYMAVDIAYGEQGLAERIGEMESFAVKDDMLRFVSQLKEGMGVVYMFSTLVVMRGDQRGEYMKALRDEITRTTKSGDAVISTERYFLNLQREYFEQDFSEKPTGIKLFYVFLRK